MSLRFRNTLVYNFSSLSIIQVANFLLSLIVIPHVIKVVGPEGFGVIAVAQVVIFYLSVITDYGFNRTAIRDVAIYKNDAQKISRIFFTVIASKLFICVITFVLLLIIVLTVPLFNEHFSLYMLAFSFVIGQVVLVNWFFQGMEKMQYMAITALISRLIFVVLVFIFIRHKGDNYLFIFFMGLGNVIAGLGGMYAAIKIYKLKFIKPSWQSVKHELKEGWPVTVTNLSMTTCQYSGLFILRLFTNDLLVGYYSIAEKIYFAMKLMLDVFSQVVYPRVCQLLQQGIDEVIVFFKKVYMPFLAMVAGGCLLIFIFSPQILYFFIGQQYSYPAFLLRMLCIATVIVCLNIPACVVLLAGDHKKSYLKIFTTGTAVNIIANIILARSFDATGTVSAVIITEVFITVGLYWELYRKYRLKPGHPISRSLNDV